MGSEPIVVVDIDVATARELINQGALLLDVREANEWAAGHAPEATHLPIAHIANAPTLIAADQQVLVICRSGNRSRVAAEALLSRGVSAVNLAGGMMAWTQRGESVIDSSGNVGTVI